MSKPLRRSLGQLVVAGFDGLSIPVELRSLARDVGLGGIILFSRNIESPEQIAELAHDAQSLTTDVPLWISVDQEGGRVARLTAPFTRWPSMASLGHSGDLGLARRFARALAAELRAVGITLDYAPVLDIHTNPRNPVIGDRALSDRAEQVAEIGGEIIAGLQAGGVAACGKHFPGHGDTSADSHLELPEVAHPPDRIRAVELEPFRAAVRRNVAVMMTAHVLYPSLDPESPATLSRRIVGELLRDELGFDGVIATDDMEMAAITKASSIEAATVRAVGVGCDMVLLCGTDVDRHARSVEALIQAVEREELSRRRVEDALARLRRVKARFLDDVPRWRPPSPSVLRGVVGREEHAAIAEEMGRFLS